MEDLILLLVLLLNAFLWVYSMMKIGFFRVVFLSFFEKKYDDFFENNMILRSVECSAVSFSCFAFWAQLDSFNLYTPLLGAFSVYWFLSYHYRNFQIVNVCKYTLKEYSRIEIIINQSKALSYNKPYVEIKKVESIDNLELDAVPVPAK